VYQAVNEFAIVDLSSFYLDVLKDRMYTFAPTSKERRSAQTVLWKISETLVRLVAPILSFTADEVWEYLPAVAGREASVHLARFPKPEEVFSEDPATLLEEWKLLLWIRDEVLLALEADRQRKLIGKSTEARVRIIADLNVQSRLIQHESSLREMLNVSQVEILGSDVSIEPTKTRVELAQEGSLTVKVAHAAGSKCARCWNFMPAVSNYGVWENVCARCQTALTEMGVARPEPAEAAQ
jgi:isoleucyl-tRNA synthetase